MRWHVPASVALAIALASIAGCDGDRAASQSPATARSGEQQARPGTMLPTQQVITPAGIQVELPGMRPQAIALSPDGHLLATSGRTNQLVLVDPASGEVLQRVPLPAGRGKGTSAAGAAHNLAPDKDAQLSYTGLVFAPDGSRIYLSDVKGTIKIFAVGADHQVSAADSFALPPTGNKELEREIPAGLALSPDGRKLYVALNVSNRLVEVDATSGMPLRTFDVGNVPFGVALAGRKAYVSNWGGRRVDGAEETGPIGESARVRVDGVRFIANEGSVSVIDLETGRTINEIMVGLHASALAVSPSGGQVVVANANSDTLSVIDVATDEVIETISTRWRAGDPFGASPTALVFNPSGDTLYACNGAMNAVAVIAFEPGRSRMRGLVPTAWYPGAIAFDAARQAVYVANIKGIGSGKRLAPGEPARFNSHQYFGSLSLIPLPSEKQLADDTETVLRNGQRRAALAAMEPARSDQALRPIPQRVGEPSVFKHVVYIIKENRTYDQVLGDMKEGNGSADLCIFGQQVTPNQHKLSREFVLLDNTYCSGINSADGHQWAASAFATDYMERSFGAFPRSYPDGMEDHDVDALAYSASGFIWDNATAHGKSLRDYGEFAISDCGWSDGARNGKPAFLDYYRDFVGHGTATHIGSRPAIASLRTCLAGDTVGWNLDVPDCIRAERFITELKQFEQAGKMPDLCIICLPSDHTSGTKPNSPTPAAQVADNDLAMGHIVEAISHSVFWKDTCVLAIEDDPQAGWDHVSAFRTTAYVVSPYTRRHAVIHERYNQPGLLRTIELILGLPPMTEFDALATPMSDCFTSTPDFTPYAAVPNQVPLDQMNPETSAIADPRQRQFAILSAQLPLEAPDQCPEDLLNRILWHAQKGVDCPYPGKAVDLSSAPRRRDRDGDDD